MAKRIEWPVKNLRIDLKNGWYWLISAASYSRPFPAEFTTDPILAGGGRWRLPYEKNEVNAAHVFEQYHYLGPLEMITYEKD